VHAGPRSLVDEEGEGLVQGRQLRAERADLCNMHGSQCSLSCTVAHLVEVVRVGDHELAAREPEHVELDEVDSGRDGGSKRRKRVLRCERRGAAMADAKRPPVAPVERDHGPEELGRVGR
jgi:hypothetical protein